MFQIAKLDKILATTTTEKTKEEGFIDLVNQKIKLENLESIGADLSLDNSNVTEILNLNKLTNVKNNIYIRQTGTVKKSIQILSSENVEINKLKTVGDYIQLDNVIIADLPELEIIENGIYLDSAIELKVPKSKSIQFYICS